jgi:hypothetical protein
MAAEGNSNQLFAKELDITVRNPLFVAVSVYRGTMRMDLRHYYEHKQTGSMMPSQRGINFPLEQAILLIKAIQEALEAVANIASNESTNDKER